MVRASSIRLWMQGPTGTEPKHTEEDKPKQRAQAKSPSKELKHTGEDMPGHVDSHWVPPVHRVLLKRSLLRQRLSAAGFVQQALRSRLCATGFVQQALCSRPRT